MNKLTTTVHATPPFDRIKALVLDSAASVHSRRAYDKALSEFLTWYRHKADGQGYTKTTVQWYARHLETMGLSASTINVRLSAVRRLAAETADNGLIDAALAVGIGRVKGSKPQGTRTRNWLTREQAEKLINYLDTTTLKGKRDRALLAALIGCGLRRSEVSELTFLHIQKRDGRWAIVDLARKGRRRRTIPMPAWAKVAIDQWADAAGISDERIFRPMNPHGRITGEPLPPRTSWRR